MQEYDNMLAYILEKGELTKNRTGIDTLSVFGYQSRFDLSKGFPAVTTKKLAWKAVVGELLWFLEGSTDERRLAEITFEKDRIDLADKKTIWTANADAQGVQLGYINNSFKKELGPVYGAQWRNFDGSNRPAKTGVDQINWLVNEIKNNSDSRRLIISAWNPNEINSMALPPCHVLSQYRVINGKLSCLLYQRSADAFLGCPFNIASYALLTHILAKINSLEVGELVYSLGDAHIYSNHIEAVREQLSREPLPLPTLELPPIESLTIEAVKAMKVSDFKLVNYLSHDTIKADMAV